MFHLVNEAVGASPDGAYHAILLEKVNLVSTAKMVSDWFWGLFLVFGGCDLVWDVLPSFGLCFRFSIFFDFCKIVIFRCFGWIVRLRVHWMPGFLFGLTTTGLIV